ncbi:MAG: DUF3516 domain-containing protein [Deltaproteobacteria bacterium]|nr:DUF3516 domain-containing protein [Deltaproteobacteria bacterium]
MSAETPTLYDRLGGKQDHTPDSLFEVFVDWVSSRALELYPAQEEAILEILTGQHVILKTPTGSGKSLVAVALHLLALAKGKRAVYTSPIKALVNEKFLDLCDVFGPARVGMMTGDSTVNRDAPVLCCTAEILANMALREGRAANAHYIVMDEFHYYADKERGVAWQIPLLLLADATFLLMSATLGDTTDIERRLEALTGKRAVPVASEQRPVPLEFIWSEDPLHEAVGDLAKGGKAPVYLVSFTQRDAADEAQNLMSQDLAPKDDKRAIADQLAGFRFDTPYGKEMQRFIRHGLGVHHGGLLPKYRLLVEKLSRLGLLRVISGTDTLGVGVNIPIRTVLFSKLCKYDGEKVRILSVRDFKQIAGRAGRKGYDTRGFVVAQAPEHVIENKRLERQVALAAASGQKKKVVKKQPPQKGYVPWSEDTFRALVEGRPEPLESAFSVTHGMLVELMQRPDNAYVKGGGYRRLVELVDMCHESDKSKRQLRRRARDLFRSLVGAGIFVVRPHEYFRGREVAVSEGLQVDFSLMQTLSLFLVEALETLDPKHPEYALDVLSFCEAIIEDPLAILHRQLDVLKGELINGWKADGVEYEERMKRLEEVTWPKPKADHLYTLFDVFEQAHPWVGHDNVHPKSIMRDMVERYMSFNEYVKELGLERMEGTLLRYLSEGFKTLVHTVPAKLRTDELMDVVAFFRTVLTRVDSSLIQEWERLMYGEEQTVATELAPPLDISRDKKAFNARIRAELHALVKALSQGDLEEAVALVKQDEADPWTAERFARALEPIEVLGGVRFDHVARLADKTQIRAEGRHMFVVRQTLLARRDEMEGQGDEAGEPERWTLEGVIDLRSDPAPVGPMVSLREIG